jgi:hypothetical protein
MFHQNYDIYNAITFFLLFLVIFETLNLVTGEQSSEDVKPQLLLVLLSLGVGLIAGFDIRNDLGPGGNLIGR